jgi:CheY-like chemotaxis protein/anti-sigma regulatory factor (Ser/Thr protein kinase)
MNTGSAGETRVLIVDDDRALRHALTSLLQAAGYSVEQASDGPEALLRLQDASTDVMLLDVNMPGMNGLDVLEKARSLPAPPAVVMMTADDAPETLVRSIEGQAFRYLRKPFAPADIVDVVKEVVAAAPAATLPIEVVSARPEWLELMAPCSLAVAERVQGFVMQLETGLDQDVRESVAAAFRELLFNAVEWGGKLDPTRKVRISCLRTKRMLLYRIADPGEGFNIEALCHAAVCNPQDDPLRHAIVREEQGLRPGGLGIAITRSLVDELVYNEARNEVVFVKYLD